MYIGQLIVFESEIKPCSDLQRSVILQSEKSSTNMSENILENSDHYLQPYITDMSEINVNCSQCYST